MKVLSILVLAVAVSLAASAAVPMKRVYDPKENDPLRIRYLQWYDEEGQLHTDDLYQPHPEVREATIDDVSFYFYTQNSGPEIIQAKDFDALVSNGNFDPSRQNIFISHGWNNNQGSNVNKYIKEAMIAMHDVNLFIVDWSRPANEFYFSAKAAVPIVGEIEGDWINQMMAKWNLTPKDFVLIGHSLGAHVAGCAGARVTGTVDFIIGLDPASPFYSLDNIHDRLDDTDAAFVKVIHTNGALLGFFSALGHSDYYPNGGRWQPGCGLDATGSCAHSRAYKYLAESILSGGFKSLRCESDDDFENGLCDTNHESYLGRYTIDKTAYGDYFLSTNDAEPFSLG